MTTTVSVLIVNICTCFYVINSVYKYLQCSLIQISSVEKDDTVTIVLFHKQLHY